MFDDCPEIKTIWVGKSSVADYLRKNYFRDSVVILPARSTMVGDRLLWELRKQREVVIPEGVQEIGGHWFKSSEIENVTIPASVRVIGKRAFYNCKGLRCVTFVEGS